MGRLAKSVVSAALLIALGGCEESVRRPVQARPPQITTPQAVSAEPLPVATQGASSGRIHARPPDGVERLLRVVEAHLKAGKKFYQAGNHFQGREELGRAREMLVLSGLDLQGDERLTQALQEVMATIRAHETTATEEEENEVGANEEPAPIEEIGEVTVSLDPSVREKAERELRQIPHDIPLTVNEHVLTYLNFFQTARGRAIVETGLRRAGRYREMISRVLSEEGLPQDLIYLAQAESAFKPAALSRAGARGIWQFMAYRGKEYGLQRSWWIDERQDPEKSTRAAARHLKDLYQEFGDWYLVMAAYNSGPGNVAKGIERTGYADFWELYKRNVLPRETRNYVPIILALTLIAKDPARYEIQAEPEPALRYDRAKLGQPIDLRLVAETLGLDLDTLRLYNPHLLQMITPADPEFELRLPVGSVERLEQDLARIPKDRWLSWRWHVVETGETLTSLARKYGVTVQSMVEVNSLQEQEGLAGGERLIVPTAARPQSLMGRLVRYRVKRGERLESVAEQFSVSVAELKKWNGLKGNRISRGMVLRVYPGGKPGVRAARSKKVAVPSKIAMSTTPPAHESGPRLHRVQQGETLWSIARAYETTVDALRGANRFLVERQLRAGDQLRIVLPGDARLAWREP